MVNIYSFDGTENVCTNITTAINNTELEALIKKGEFIPRGNGLSYCGASLSQKSTILSSTLMNKILHFDKINLSLTVESGITIGEVLQFLSKEKLWLSVIPGHPNITIGGCVAFNVHGKNQYKFGNFKDHIEELVLYHPEYGYKICSPSINTNIFNLTVGGAGLTGFITSVKIKLYKPKSFIIQRKKLLVNNIEMLPMIFKKHCDDALQIFSWHNFNKKDEGFIFIDSYLDDDTYVITKEKEITLNNLVNAQNRRVNIFQHFSPIIRFKEINSIIYFLQKQYRKDRTLSLYESNFPLASISYYYKLFGKSGFREYQCIVPTENWSIFIKSLKKLLNEYNVIITLASTKYFKGDNLFLNFNGNGICLTLNMFNDLKTMRMLTKLDQIVAHHHAIINISKDSRLQSKTAQDIFSGYDNFKHELALYDGRRCINSLLRERLDV